MYDKKKGETQNLAITQDSHNQKTVTFKFPFFLNSLTTALNSSLFSYRTLLLHKQNRVCSDQTYPSFLKTMAKKIAEELQSISSFRSLVLVLFCCCCSCSCDCAAPSCEGPCGLGRGAGEQAHRRG